MGWLVSIINSVLLTAALGFSVPSQPLGIWSIYGKKIEYQNFSKINFSQISKKEILVPTDLKAKLDFNRNYSLKTKNQELLEELIMKEVNKLGVKETEIPKLSPKKAIMLSMDVAAKSIDYFKVDDDKQFLAEHGASLPIEEYMQLGKGDCDKYTKIAAASFNLFKKDNPQLKNIYLLNDQVGPNEAHAWVTVVILAGNKIITSALDPTYYDHGDKLEGKKGNQVSYNKSEQIADFYHLMRNYRAEYSILQDALQNEVLTLNDQERFSYKLIAAAYILSDRERIESARDFYWKLEGRDYLDKILYQLYRFEISEENQELAETYKKWLIEFCPKSDYAEKLISQ